MTTLRKAWLPLLACLAIAACDDSSGNGPSGGDEDDDCQRSSFCPLDFVCDRDSGECVLGECAFDVACTGGQTCGPDHFCRPPCTSNADCELGKRCFVPDGRCYGGEPCSTTADCPAPAGSVGSVLCNDLVGQCETDFAACTQATGWDDCAEGEYCHVSGWCAPQPVICTDDTCRPGTHCNLATGACDPDPTCDMGDCADPVDSECRLCLCTSDGQCEPDEWCDHMNTGMCRGKCSDASGCLAGEKCEATRCVADQGCPEGEECTNDLCACAVGLTCWARPGDTSGKEYCLKACDPIAAASGCPSGKRCAPLADGGSFSLHRGGCVAENLGGQAGDACDATTPCEVDNFCVEAVCRSFCDPDNPECGAAAICVDQQGIGVCVPEPTCRSDVECNPPGDICDLSVFPGQCTAGCNMTGCDGGYRCNGGTGRCDPDRSCQDDVICGAPNYVCASGKCTAGCMFIGCNLPLTCNHTSGRCDQGCAVDQDCYPPDHICEGDQCVEGCVATGCDNPKVCNPSTGRCSADTCQKDEDCNPPNSVCDLALSLKCKPGCITVGCEPNHACNVETGRCDAICIQDSECSPPNTICQAGRCETGCVDLPDPKCPAGTDCDPTTGRCKPTFCAQDSHCDPPHYICDFGTSLCVHGCVYNGCGPGENCNQTTGRCQ